MSDQAHQERRESLYHRSHAKLRAFNPAIGLESWADALKALNDFDRWCRRDSQSDFAEDGRFYDADRLEPMAAVVLFEEFMRGESPVQCGDRPMAAPPPEFGYFDRPSENLRVTCLRGEEPVFSKLWSQDVYEDAQKMLTTDARERSALQDRLLREIDSLEVRIDEKRSAINALRPKMITDVAPIPPPPRR